MNREREQLQKLVEQWNENRLDLFHLSQPTENLEVEGVMRFYFQNQGERVSTKCIRVSSTATTRAVIDALVEKFVPDLRMLTTPEYSLWEVHEGGEERRLEIDEKPLVVQLMWHKDDREGRFLLKNNANPYVPLSALQLHDKEDATIKHFSKKSKDHERKKPKIVSVNAGREEKYSPPDIYQQIPSTTFTRTISNPEIVMKKRRERKLEAKLNEIGQMGGSLKIYGSQLDPTRPYVTLLLSTRDTTQHIVREALEKYNLLAHIHPNDVSLVESLSPPDERRSIADLSHIGSPNERILDPNECPLLTIGNRGPGAPEVFFYLRHRPSHYKQISSTSIEMISRVSEPKRGGATEPNFILLSHGISQGQLLPIKQGITEVGCDEALAQFSPQNIILEAVGVKNRHCVITFEEGVVTITPSSQDAHIEVNDHRIIQTAILNDRDVIRLGADCFLRYLHSRTNAQIESHFTPRSSLSTNLDQIRLSVSSMGSTTQNAPHHDQHGQSGDHARPIYETAYRVPSNNHNNNHLIDGLPIPQGPPMVIQVNDYSVWDFFNEVLSRGSEEAHPFRSQLGEFDNPEVHPFRLAPSFALYLSLRFFHSHQKPYLVQFITRIATQLNHKAQECDQSDELLFWLANCSELAFLIESDYELQPLAQQRGASLSACVEPLLRRVVDVLSSHLIPSIDPFFDENIPDQQATSDVLAILDGCVRCARGVRLNAALTIQVASHLLHTLNVVLFNTLVGKRPMKDLHLSLSLGERLKARLSLVMEWAERNGLELAAECHLHTIQQASIFLAASKTNVEEMGTACDKLNSLQIKYLLDHYRVSENEPPMEERVLQSVIQLSERHADVVQGEGRQLEENSAFPLPFLLPQEGYVAEQLHGAPESLLAYVLRLQQRGFLHSAATLDPRSSWIVKQPIPGVINTHAAQNGATPSPNPVPNGFAQQMPKTNFGESFESSLGFVPPPPISSLPTQRVNETRKISLQRGSRGIGLSIVAAQGVGDPHVGIYVKKVVDGGPAALDGRLEAGDQLLSVNGMPLINITQEEAAQRMGSAGANVVFEVRKGAALGNGLAQWLCQTTPQTPSMGAPTPASQQPIIQHLPQPPTLNKPQQQSYVQRQPPGNKMISTTSVEGPPRHQRSASVSELYSNDPNQSISGRSICSTDFAPPSSTQTSMTSTGGSTRLPSRYRPTVIQPGRASSGAQSPSALRKTAPSPTNLNAHQPQELRPFANSSPASIFTEKRPIAHVQPPPMMSSQQPNLVYHSNHPSTSSHQSMPIHEDPRPSNVPVFRATSLGPSPPTRLSPPISQSSPRDTTRSLKDHSHFPFDPSSPSKDNYANLPLHQERESPQYAFPRGSEWIRSAIQQGFPQQFPSQQPQSHQPQIQKPPVQLVRKEPAIVRPLNPTVSSPGRTPLGESKTTTTFGVTNAVPTPLLLAQQQNGRPSLPLSSLHSHLHHTDVRRGDIMTELDRLDTKAMTEQETERYRQLLDEMAQERRGMSVPVRKIPIRHETVIDDVDPHLQREISPMRYSHDIEPMDSPAIMGSNEVYSDPRLRRLNEIQAQSATTPSVDGSNLAFHDKMRLFAKQIGENTPKYRAKESSAQRHIERSS
ncbi:unnamed protein product, partial [Mesorhabditis belari]|uniref:Afadin n=1 Tax=Mesorhabditis belari TaxID=2138241 RepID=A0AAF3ED57_9BILA